ncbi:hypothetical protein [Periweissella cryptocerci]|uniref:hypothetical protein n=1 Tax=Periweissella cryptocerci TaxID=2506420 RepID=UPI001404C178|nr:hypothetical protein [Periweissella cryptocerci]
MRIQFIIIYIGKNGVVYTVCQRFNFQSIIIALIMKVHDYDLHSFYQQSFQRVHKLGRIIIPKYNVNIPIVYGIDNSSLLVGANFEADEKMGAEILHYWSQCSRWKNTICALEKAKKVPKFMLLTTNFVHLSN